MKFLKFEFANEAEWLTVKDSLYEDEALIPEITAIHEIGFICLATNEEGECIDLSTKYAVDMLCEEIEWLAPFVVYPNPSGFIYLRDGLRLIRLSFAAFTPIVLIA
jgi:hypothetical protein